MEITLQAISLITTIQILENDWMISQEFLKNGNKIWIKGFGRDKREALQDFDAEVETERLYL